MLDLNDLRLFVAIVEHQGILKAGRALNLPKSTMSRRLAGLEAQLKTRLIIRSGEAFTLTPAGQDAYDLGLRVVQAARDAEDRLLRARQDIAGQVMLSATSLIAARLPYYLTALTGPHPRLSFTLDVSERDPDPVSDPSDLLLRAHAWSLRDSALIQRRICRNPLILVAAPAYLVKYGTPLAPADVAAHDLLAYGIDARPETGLLSNAAGQVEMLTTPPRLITANAAVLVQAGLEAQGLVLVPEFVARDALASGALRRLLPDWTGPAVAVTLLTPSRQNMNATLRYCADQIALQVKSDILSLGQQVPKQEPHVPELPPGVVTKLTHGRLSPQMRPGSHGPAPSSNSTESDMPMTPFQTVLGTAALTTATALALPVAAQDAAGPLVLYTNDFEGAITDRFEADTGREVDVVQMSGGEILARIAAEAANPQWDVLIFNGSYTFHMLDQQEALLRGVEPANLGNLNEIGQTYLPENRSWFPIGLAASCVMLYRTDLVETPPTAFADLADPRFNGQFGMADPAVAAPAYPCVAQFFEELGDQGARDLFTSFFENGMRVFRTNGPTGAALASGDISLALITSQVAYTVMAEGEVPVSVVWPEDGAPGVVRGVGISASTARPEAAKAFVDWLLEPDTQSHLAAAIPSDGKFEPTVTGAVRRPDGPPEGQRYLVASDDFAVEHEADIKTWFADQALN
ncbi:MULTISPECIES: extracellular solute-binding protein [unclassified Yoonia]|uniref:extracellular solute-binding protein n=1 Tax=unclassified Yoonia TaxID=2629118 RepID=UPI002AFE6599|nr:MULTISPECIES: extracellular solute-binding protein [unclassified Yoonia]